MPGLSGEQRSAPREEHWLPEGTWQEPAKQ
jgi:hypothetical protein